MSTTSCDCLNCSSGNGQPCLVADVPMGRAGSGDTFVLTGAGNPNYMPPPPVPVVLSAPEMAHCERPWM